MNGEWWYDGYSLQYADGDIGDMNHEGMAMAHFAGMVLDALGIDNDDRSMSLEAYQEEISSIIGEGMYIAAAIGEDVSGIPANILVGLATGVCDPVFGAVKYLGWIRIKGHHVEAWELNTSTLRDICRAVDDILEDTDDGRLDEDVPLFVEFRKHCICSEVTLADVRQGDVLRFRKVACFG